MVFFFCRHLIDTHASLKISATHSACWASILNALACRHMKRLFLFHVVFTAVNTARNMSAADVLLQFDGTADFSSGRYRELIVSRVFHSAVLIRCPMIQLPLNQLQSTVARIRVLNVLDDGIEYSLAHWSKAASKPIYEYHRIII